jgi:3-oxoadipate enol-lactonase
MRTPLGVLLVMAVVNTSAAPAQTAATSPGSFVAVDGGRLYTEECGSGPDALLLIHDGVVHSAVWDAVWPSFCKRFHTIRYDRRGYGKSPATTAWYSETDDVAAVLRHAGVKQTTVIGSSHGGEVSIDFTLAHPDMVKRLVLVGAVVGGFSYTEHFITRNSTNSALFRKGDIPGGIKAWSNDRYLIAPGNDAARQQLLALLLANPQDMTHSDQAIPPKPALGRLGEIRVPTLVLVGDADIPDVHAHAGAIEAGIRNARRIVIPGVGHIMYLEKPDVFVRTVMAFLDANP